MKGLNISHYWNTFLKFADKNTPHILTAAALVGLVETGVLAFKAGPKAQEIWKTSSFAMERLESADISEEFRKRSKRELTKTTVKEMVPVITPPILVGSATAACIVASDHVSTKRIATLSAAYTIVDTAYKEYKTKAEEVMGDKKARNVREALAKDKVQKDPPKQEIEQAVLGPGEVLCKDGYSGRYFYSTHAKIERAINLMAHRCMTEMYVDLNCLYDEIGLERVSMGYDLGWNADDLVRGELPITITTTLSPNNVPCLMLDYDIRLREDFTNLH